MGRSIGYENYRTMDEKMKKNEELQSRREFFKKAAKGALPILGAVLLANVPVVSQAVESDSMSCKYMCQISCRGGCKNSCGGSCKGSCQTYCKGGCRGLNYH